MFIQSRNQFVTFSYNVYFLNVRVLNFFRARQNGFLHIIFGLPSQLSSLNYKNIYFVTLACPLLMPDM